ncbi:type II secretion system minor pseudopilin GspJ [Klebsiella sp. NPDC088457]
MSRNRIGGFTLVEMLLALAILAALSMAAVAVLQNVIRADRLTRDKGLQIQALQSTFSQMAADFNQIIPRRSRGSASLFFAGRFQLNSDDWALAFSRNGWPNPLGMLPRSEIQNVSYRLRQQQLERLSYDQQDPLTGTQPTVEVLQSGVTTFRLRFYAEGRWQERWDSAQSLPQGLEVTLTLAGYGEMTRLFLLTPGAGQ